MKPEKIDLNTIERLLPEIHAAIISSPGITEKAVFFSNVAGASIVIYTQRKESIHIDDMKPLLKYIERIGTDYNGHLFFGLRTTKGEKKAKIKKQLLNLYYLTIDANTEDGFAHVITTDGLCIQCCLIRRKDGKGYKKAVNRNDSGINDGICGDVNKKAFEKYGEDNCTRFLFTELRKIGVIIR